MDIIGSAGSVQVGRWSPSQRSVEGSRVSSLLEESPFGGSGGSAPGTMRIASWRVW
jgi:hypothetical protein